MVGFAQPHTAARSTDFVPTVPTLIQLFVLEHTAEMSTLRILVTEPELLHADALASLEEFATVTRLEEKSLPNSPDEMEAMLLEHVAKGFDALFIRAATKVSASVLAAGKEHGLKVIGTATLGRDHVDPAGLEATGIELISLSGTVAHTIPTAEHVMALLLAVTRNVVAAQDDTVEGMWDSRHLFLGHSLRDKTLGIVGLGSIGQYVANIASAGFHMSVKAVDPYASDEAFLAVRAERVASLEDLLPQVDVLTLHCILNDETRGMIGKEQIDALRPGSYIINCGRGPLIDEDALIDALESGHLAGAGLDVFVEEPLSSTSRVAQYADTHRSNLVITPHLGASTHEALRDGGTIIASRLRTFLLDA